VSLHGKLIPSFISANNIDTVWGRGVENGLIVFVVVVVVFVEN